MIFKYIKVKYASSSYCGGTTFTKDMINYLPLPNLTTEISAKSVDLSADTTEEEKAIDKIVYEIYGITDQSEIEMIEGK